MLCDTLDLTSMARTSSFFGSSKQSSTVHLKFCGSFINIPKQQYIEQWAIWLHILNGLKLLQIYSLIKVSSGVLAWWRWKELETGNGRSVYFEARGLGFWGFNEYKLPLFFLYLLWALVLSAGWWVGWNYRVCSGWAGRWMNALQK